MKKLSLILLCVLMITGTAFAGGSIFGHHKKTRNANGVSSIGIKICGSLMCPDVIIKQGSCGDIQHATQQYGVCVCDDGYKVKDGECILATQENCIEPGEKWCSGLNNCIPSNNCCSVLSVPDCKVCDSDTGNLTDKDKGLCTINSKKDAGYCFAGECLNPCDGSPIDNCKTFSPSSGECICEECNNGYTLIVNHCVQIPEYTCDLTIYNVAAEARNLSLYTYDACTDKNGTHYKQAGCATGYQWNEGLQECELIPQYTCDLTIYNVATEARNLSLYTYDACTDKNGTHYKQAGCATGYQWNNTECVPIPEYTCDLTIYNVATEARNLSLYTYDACTDKDGTHYKQAGCASGYQWNDTECVAIPEYTCDTSFNVAAEARNFTLYTYDACTDKDGTHYKQAGCATGYQWNDTECVAIPEYTCDASYNVATEARNLTLYTYDACTDKDGTHYKQVGCATGYQWNDTECVAIPEYTCDTSFNVVAEARNLTLYTYDACTDKNGTHYKQAGCATGYQWNDTECVAIPEYTCDLTIYNVVAEARNLTLYTYDACTDKNGTHYKQAGCATGYQWNDTECVAIPEYTCDTSFNVVAEARNLTLYTYDACTDKNGTHYKQAGCATGYQWNEGEQDCELIPEYTCDTSFNVAAEARNLTLYTYDACTDKDGTRYKQAGCATGYQWNEGEQDCEPETDPCAGIPSNTLCPTCCITCDNKMTTVHGGRACTTNDEKEGTCDSLGVCQENTVDKCEGVTCPCGTCNSATGNCVADYGRNGTSCGVNGECKNGNCIEHLCALMSYNTECASCDDTTGTPSWTMNEGEGCHLTPTSETLDGVCNSAGSCQEQLTCEGKEFGLCYNCDKGLPVLKAEGTYCGENAKCDANGTCVVDLCAARRDSSGNIKQCLNCYPNTGATSFWNAGTTCTITPATETTEAVMGQCDGIGNCVDTSEICGEAICGVCEKCENNKCVANTELNEQSCGTNQYCMNGKCKVLYCYGFSNPCIECTDTGTGPQYSPKNTGGACALGTEEEGEDPKGKCNSKGICYDPETVIDTDCNGEAAPEDCMYCYNGTWYYGGPAAGQTCTVGGKSGHCNSVGACLAECGYKEGANGTWELTTQACACSGTQQMYLPYLDGCTTVSGISVDEGECLSNANCLTTQYCRIDSYRTSSTPYIPQNSSCQTLPAKSFDVQVKNPSGIGTKRMIGLQSSLTWDSARNWCLAQGGRMVSLTDFGINRCSESSTTNDLEKCGSNQVWVKYGDTNMRWSNGDTGYYQTIISDAVKEDWATKLSTNYYWMAETWNTDYYMYYFRPSSGYVYSLSRLNANYGCPLCVIE